MSDINIDKNVYLIGAGFFSLVPKLHLGTQNIAQS